MDAFFGYNITFAAFVNIRRVCENGKGASKSVDFNRKKARTIHLHYNRSAVSRSAYRVRNIKFTRTNFRSSEFFTEHFDSEQQRFMDIKSDKVRYIGLFKRSLRAFSNTVKRNFGCACGIYGYLFFIGKNTIAHNLLRSYRSKFPCPPNGKAGEQNAFIDYLYSSVSLSNLWYFASAFSFASSKRTFALSGNACSRRL